MQYIFPFSIFRFTNKLKLKEMRAFEARAWSPINSNAYLKCNFMYKIKRIMRVRERLVIYSFSSQKSDNVKAMRFSSWTSRPQMVGTL